MQPKEVIDKLHKAIETFKLSNDDFISILKALIEYQYNNNELIKRYIDRMEFSLEKIEDIESLPFIPISAFKEFDISIITPEEASITFISSGTTTSIRSRHYFSEEQVELYKKALWQTYKNLVFADKEPYPIFSMIHPLELQPQSSLSFMVHHLVEKTGNDSKYFFDGDKIDFKKLYRTIRSLNYPIVLFTTLSALYYFVEFIGKGTLGLPEGSYIIHTGGTKGINTRNFSMTMFEDKLVKVFNISIDNILSEYGMAELTSQFYTPPKSTYFASPPWAKVILMDPLGKPIKEDPEKNPKGAIAVVDLLNINSYIAIETEDYGQLSSTGFKVKGRLKLAEPKGCSLISIHSIPEYGRKA